VRIVTLRRTTGLAAVLVAGALALAPAPHASSAPYYTPRYVVFVTMTGKGTVLSRPHGINCPRDCRGVWVRGTHIRVAAVAAAGWRFAGFSSKWCQGPTTVSCQFDLVSPHDCVGGACPLGAFGIRAAFVRRA
jgi:hypothetical protein